jgi:hypothetical protein
MTSRDNYSERIPIERAPWGQFPSWIGMARAACALIDAGASQAEVLHSLQLTSWSLRLMRSNIRRNDAQRSKHGPTYRSRGR